MRVFLCEDCRARFVPLEVKVVRICPVCGSRMLRKDGHIATGGGGAIRSEAVVSDAKGRPLFVRRRYSLMWNGKRYEKCVGVEVGKNGGQDALQDMR